MAKKAEDVLEKEATRIGYEKMLADLQELIDAGLSEAQRIAIADQQGKIRERLTPLQGGE